VVLVRTDVSERLINRYFTVKQLLNPFTLRNPEDRDVMFRETSVLTRATRYKVPKDIYHSYISFNTLRKEGES
jgi:hypothetical protein